MNVEIIYQPFYLTVYGFGGVVQNNDYVGTAFKLMDKMWQVVRAEGLKHKGLNIWVYEPGKQVFAGVEIEGEPAGGTALQQKTVSLSKYARCKHIGPYSLIKQAGTRMTDELRSKGIETGLPYIEIYGHWQNDESKLETDLVTAIK